MRKIFLSLREGTGKETNEIERHTEVWEIVVTEIPSDDVM
jgi:hypothetical protein